jgi:hypothetical protein
MKTIAVVDDNELPYEPDGEKPHIIQFTAYPNPVTTDYLTVVIELREVQDITLTLYDIYGAVKWQQTSQGKAYYTLRVPASGLTSSWYLLLLTSGREQATRKIVAP